jgi:hypothetical protein
VRVCLDCIGEGWNGDYNSEDPKDEILLRFDVYIEADYYVPGFTEESERWQPVDDASYCTALPESASQEQQDRAVEIIMGEVKDALQNGYSIKKLCERLSWLDKKWIREYNKVQARMGK